MLYCAGWVPNRHETLLMVAQRPRPWAIIKPALGQRLVFAGTVYLVIFARF